MLWNASALNGYRIEATDGHLGTARDLLFDDQSWAVRWLVVDTGHWLPERQVLLPATALGIPDAGLRQMPVRLTRQQVQDAPGAEADLPVSRQMELHLSGHYGTEAYWARGSDAFPLRGFPHPTEPRHHIEGEDIVADMGDAHLRSAAAVTGYHLHATDGDIGHVRDVVVDDAGWHVTYLAVDTHVWRPGGHVLIMPRQVRAVDWQGSQMDIGVTRQKVRDSPPTSSAVTVDRAYAEAMSVYYGLSLFAV